MQHRKRITAAAAAALLPIGLGAQVATTWEAGNPAGAEGIVTAVEHDMVGEDDYAAQGILADWNDILKEFEATSDDGSVEKEITALTGRTVFDWHLPEPGKGLLTGLPQVLDEDGTDLFMLTRDGIYIYLAADAPAYFQEVDDDVVRWVRFYARSKKAYTRRLFKRYESWEPKIKDYFRSCGIPEELAELCLIESGCTYGAKSHAGAVGMWQIMPETGRSYGMRIDQKVDDRLDPVVSTQTAARILRNNYRRLGEWTIATAAYNCGAGRFRQGQQWNDVKGRLPKETQQYIPGLIAIHYVWTYRKRLGL